MSYRVLRMTTNCTIKVNRQRYIRAVNGIWNYEPDSRLISKVRLF
jgi:hypothetical protein